MAATAADLAHALVERHRTRIEAELQRAGRLRLLLETEVADLLRAGQIRRAWLIGTLPWGAWGEGSDVDLVVEGLAPGEHAALWWRLSGQLGAPVDLLELERLPASFRERVLAEGVPLHVP